MKNTLDFSTALRFTSVFGVRVSVSYKKFIEALLKYHEKMVQSKLIEEVKKEEPKQKESKDDFLLTVAKQMLLGKPVYSVLNGIPQEVKLGPVNPLTNPELPWSLEEPTETTIYVSQVKEINILEIMGKLMSGNLYGDIFMIHMNLEDASCYNTPIATYAIQIKSGKIVNISKV